MIQVHITRSSYLEVLVGKGILKMCSKFTGEHPCRSVISHGNLLYIFRKPFPKNGRLLLCYRLALPIQVFDPNDSD